ncbi:MAG TPA: MFS transporter, partial [Solirubrobacteraceae bacterium]|nr:MFS transporter [Solirubrobacteraceae bacterium]
MNRELLQQPKAVWAVAFACVISFMGIGLVDPILPALAENLDASPSQVSLLFTSYFAVTGIAMLGTGFVSSRLGAKRTLLAGLTLIIAFAALAGLSDTVDEIVGFRAGWGLGNALFIATSLATIVGAASGGVAGSIILYEAALGLGIASGPLLGGLLGGISWRGPFFGVAVLMAVALVAVVVLLDTPKQQQPARRIGITEPLRALAHPGLRTLAIVAVLYNFGFFTLLAYTPFPLDMGEHALGIVFFGWGLLLALFSVIVAPALKRRLGTVGALGGAFALLAADLLGMGLLVDSQAALVVGVVLAGAFLGVVNTVLTETVMVIAPVERPVASSAYSFVRFTGGAAAPYIAGKLAEHIGPDVPFYVGAGTVAAAIVVLVAWRALITPHEDAEDPHAAAPAKPPVPAVAPVLVAVDGSPDAGAVSRAAADLARARSSDVVVVHVRETDVLGDQAADLESQAEARRVVERHLQLLARRDIEATGEVVDAVGDHEDAAEAVLAAARRTGADALVLGR